MKTAVINGNQVEYNETEFEVLKDRDQEYLHYIGDGSKPVLNPKGNTSCYKMFFACNSLHQLDLLNFDTSNVTDMSYMFESCINLQQLDLSNFDTSNVTDMCEMFYSCESLQQLDLSNFDTSNVNDMSTMFGWCHSLRQLDLSNFDTSNVTDMRDMFGECDSLQQLDLSNFDTSNVTDMMGMFFACNSLYQIDLSNFDTRNVTKMSVMFKWCSSLSQLDLLNFDISKVTNMFETFYDCNFQVIVSSEEIKTKMKELSGYNNIVVKAKNNEYSLYNKVYQEAIELFKNGKTVSDVIDTLGINKEDSKSLGIIVSAQKALDVPEKTIYLNLKNCDIKPGLIIESLCDEAPDSEFISDFSTKVVVPEVFKMLQVTSNRSSYTVGEVRDKLLKKYPEILVLRAIVAVVENEYVTR